MSKSRNRKTTKSRPATLDPQKDQAAIVFLPDGLQLFAPEHAAPRVQFAIAIWCRMKDRAWVQKQQRWTAEMQQLGQADRTAIVEGASNAMH